MKIINGKLILHFRFLITLIVAEKVTHMLEIVGRAISRDFLYVVS
ncbi:hypothetical protein GPLA_2470 [Paraglaciecola polaris LMG 21857]|uniref:Uncharacterized protein n=1 Tax=Paraglaciecola polaris LMG 21857 TaxID=1129793 RepID=K6ZSW3_9ALTE|nr:hypothetical protein GPLA_2470 [Paraglaciecola polaris LMG 21857]